MDLPSVLGGLAQGFVDFGKSAVDLFGTGGAAFADLIQGTGTKNQDDFRKWLYQTDSVQDAAAKGLGTALNGAQTISDYVIPGGISKSLLFNAGQGALGGLADEFKTYGENYDLGRAGQRALVSAGAAGAGTGLANALKKSGSGLLQSGLAQGASRGALSGAINQGGYAAIDGGDIAQSALQGAGMGALLGGATGAVQDFMPRKQQYMPLTDEEKTARIANAKQMLETATTPERRAELQAQINRLGGTLENTLAADDMAVNAAMEPEGFTYDYDGSDMAAVQRAYNLATQDQAKLDGMLKEISDTLGTEFSSAGQKSTKSMLDKIERKVRSGRDYTVSSMKDHTRGKVMMNNFSEIPQVLQELDRRGIPYETEVVTNNWGYKGYHITFRNPDGISSEIQLTTAAHWPAKLESDAIYDKWRNFDYDSATKAERQKYHEAMAKSQALWAKVDFNDFDKTANSLSDTGRASWSVEPSTLKSGLTQEPSLYTKTPSSSESANMSPSSVIQTSSGLGFDKSPNIDSPPFDDIIPQNTSKSLEGTLSNADMAVNSVPDTRASYGGYGYGGYGDSFDANVKSIGSQDVAPIDPATLPESYDFYKKVTGMNKNKYGYAYDAVTQETGKSASKITKADLEAYLKDNYPDYYDDSKKYTKWELEKDITAAIEDGLVDEGYENGADLSALVHNRYPRAGIRDIYTDHQGKTGRLDRELSRRLGIGESTSPLMDKLNNDTGGAAGDVNGRFLGVKHDSWTGGTGEDKLSTMGHERLHLIQNVDNSFDYEQVQPVYRELSENLSKAMLTDDELTKVHGKNFGRGHDLEYYKRPVEQEARMLEAYLYDRGYTKGRPYRADEFASKMGIIRPAFDKFFDKLRDLSKRGVALPAITGLVGGGAVLEQILNSKDEDKKKTNKRSA